VVAFPLENTLYDSYGVGSRKSDDTDGSDTLRGGKCDDGIRMIMGVQFDVKICI